MAFFPPVPALYYFELKNDCFLLIRLYPLASLDVFGGLYTTNPRYIFKGRISKARHIT